MTIIAMWSGPRNISTAMMYAFANRDDCVAWDEPFYGAYLKATGLLHPMCDEIITANETDPNKISSLCSTPSSKPLFYQKHMTHHMIHGFDRSLTKKASNSFLIRSPEKVLASYAKKHDDVSLHAIGFVEQAEIFDDVANILGHAPPVIDADIHLNDPHASLTKLCSSLKIEFDEKMLSWPKGPKPCDGVWASHWYNAAWASTGFAKPEKQDITLPAHLQKIADAARPYYERLHRHHL